MVTNWTVEDNVRIAELDNPAKAERTRYQTEIKLAEPSMMRVADALTDFGMEPDNWQGSEMMAAAKAAIKTADEHPETSLSARLVGYRSILLICFGDQVTPPTDLDDRDDFELVKRKLERRIAELAGDPNTITAVAEHSYDAHQVRKDVRRKYRGNIKKLTDFMGNVPISHVTAASLRRFRDQQSATMMASSLAAVFTPIRGMFRYAVDEELIEINQMPSVMLKKDKRSVHERKCIPYPPLEMKRLLEAMNEHWGSPKRAHGRYACD
jgi:hypothetical protein